LSTANDTDEADDADGADDYYDSDADGAADVAADDAADTDDANTNDAAVASAVDGGDGELFFAVVVNAALLCIPGGLGAPSHAVVQVFSNRILIEGAGNVRSREIHFQRYNDYMGIGEDGPRRAR
jgi:hypothetical protein